jgi:capsular polysaccharide biosynthesis protein
LLNTALAIGFGLFFGLVMAVLVELFDRRIRSAEDFEDAAGAPVIVVVPKRAA